MIVEEDQIKQKAREYSGIAPDVKNIDTLMFSSRIEEVLTFEKYNAFIAGANFGKELGMKEAFEWKSIRESLPKNQNLVLVKTDKGAIMTAYLHGEASGFISYGEDAYIEAGEITHWRPINQEDMP